VRTLAPPHAEECRADGEDPEGIAIPSRGGGCQLHALLRPPCRRSACARVRPTRVVPRQPIHFPLADARPQASSVDGDSGEGARRTRVRARPRTQTLTARTSRSSQDPNTGSDCGAGGSSSADRTHPSGQASERRISTAADGGPGDLEDARGDASTRMMRKQDKGGPFFGSQLESLTNPWPISIRVGQSGPWLSSAPSCAELASRPTPGGPVERHHGPTRAFQNGSRPDRSTAQRRTACAADPRQVDRRLAPSGAPSAGSSAAENDAHATPSRERGEPLLGT
jgi:hypothetical protein